MKQPEYVDVERRAEDGRSVELWRFNRAGEIIHYRRFVRWFRWQNFWGKEEWSKSQPPRVPADVAFEARLMIEEHAEMYEQFRHDSARPRLALVHEEITGSDQRRGFIRRLLGGSR